MYYFISLFVPCLFFLGWYRTVYIFFIAFTVFPSSVCSLFFLEREREKMESGRNVDKIMHTFLIHHSCRERTIRKRISIVNKIKYAVLYRHLFILLFLLNYYIWDMILILYHSNVAYWTFRKCTIVKFSWFLSSVKHL